MTCTRLSLSHAGILVPVLMSIINMFWIHADPVVVSDSECVELATGSRWVRETIQWLWQRPCSHHKKKKRKNICTDNFTNTKTEFIFSFQLNGSNHLRVLNRKLALDPRWRNAADHTLVFSLFCAMVLSCPCRELWEIKNLNENPFNSLRPNVSPRRRSDEKGAEPNGNNFAITTFPSTASCHSITV